jgi:hypothetical protein
LKIKHVVHGLALLPTPLRILAGIALAGAAIRRHRRKKREQDTTWSEAARLEGRA